MGEIGAMVLAAGLSERMSGELPKQLLPLGDTTVAGQTVRNAEASQLDRIAVVTGFRADEVAAAVAGGRAEIVFNPDFESGNMSSFRAGAEALADCDAVVVLLADMPSVTTAMIDRVVAVWREHRPWAARCLYEDGPAHPLLFSAAALREAAAIDGPKGTWRILDSASAELVATIEFAMPAPTDINTSADYDRATGAQPGG